MLDSFSNEEYALVHLNVSQRRSTAKNSSRLRRVIDGFLDLVSVCKRTLRIIHEHSFVLMHTTTSGNIGTLRDYMLVRICHKNKIKCIMHCRYGCITEDFSAKGFWGDLLRKTMHKYDNVWVLDKRSEKALNEDPLMRGKVFLTPNSIEVPDECDLSPKEYNKIAFVGNLIPSKGLFELIHAVADFDLKASLIIAGPGGADIVKKMENISGDKWNSQIKYVGKLKNEDAVRLIKTVDFIVLASYYPSEAFPISIIEAMSNGKLVIATRRAAIPDMLTDIDGKPCGCLVREKSIEDIVNAIRWCQEHSMEADKMCEKAYEKVKACYRTDVVYELYRSLYNRLIVQ